MEEPSRYEFGDAQTEIVCEYLRNSGLNVDQYNPDYFEDYNTETDLRHGDIYVYTEDQRLDIDVKTIRKDGRCFISENSINNFCGHFFCCIPYDGDAQKAIFIPRAVAKAYYKTVKTNDGLVDGPSKKPGFLINTNLMRSKMDIHEFIRIHK
jgi:hypothetical protein